MTSVFDILKIRSAEQIAIQQFPEYHLEDEQARRKLKPEQKKEVVAFLINLGLQMGLKPKK